MALTSSPFMFVAIIATLPSLFWLAIYLREDSHPEPKRIIIKLFLLGFILPPFVAVGEDLLKQGTFGLSGAQTTLPQGFFILLLVLAAFWEEVVKYIAARVVFHHEKEFDEMTDAMVYLITVALGFAASENIIIILSALKDNPSQNIFILLGLRTLGANLLHTFASGMLGYFLARGLFLKERFGLTRGLVSATAVHTLFNYLILQITPDHSYTIISVIALLVAALIIILKDFDNLKRYESR